VLGVSGVAASPAVAQNYFPHRASSMPIFGRNNDPIQDFKLPHKVLITRHSYSKNALLIDTEQSSRIGQGTRAKGTGK
jgi:hypothetical protein